ncbi:MAG: zinc-dependent peptidase [Alphaproteobacteria bacterium]|nr:zinc-dependent peptidase [Alphaproteobacteria bacterium]
MFAWWRARRRNRIRERPIPATWRPLLQAEAPFFRELSADRQAQLLSDLAVFLDEHGIVAAGGLELTEEIRVLVGASAVRLTLGLDLDHYQRLTEVVVYPYEVILDADHERELLGVAHRHGTVVLSWPAVQRGLRRPHDGHDTAVHEFAHALDLADGSFDGAPALRASDHYRSWAHVLGEHFARLQQGDPALLAVLRPYGGTEPPEMFAVATEAFFERPAALRRKAPELYAELQRFYGQDPAATR